MAKYVFLTDGVVTDRTQIDPYTVFEEHYASQFIEAPEEVEHFWTFDGTNWTPPPEPTIEQRWEFVRFQRNGLLSQSDTNVLPDRWAAMTSEKQQEWTTFRQELRDITKTFATPEEVVWPARPE
jgi:hypothetical protein